MCWGIPDQESSTDMDLTLTRRPTGTRRRQLEWLTNFVLVVVSLFGCSVGCGLLGFYKIHLLSFVSFEFYIIPLVLLGGGLFTLMVSVVGLLATSKRSPCLLVFYAFCLCLAFLVLAAGVVSSVRIIFIIYLGIDHGLALPLVKEYGTDPHATEIWDSLQETYRCCGAETTFDLGYMVWQTNKQLQAHHAVPDSCCLKRKRDCGYDIFVKHELIKMSEYVKKIHVHGCIRAMEYVLKDHVAPILFIFAISGTVLAIVELLGVVLACCLANVILEENRESLRTERVNTLKRMKAAEENFDI
ncbi:CD63 antigen-like [Tigriopus californicus]|uniref:CD63 antigen-like n=1 Tax=Tigriopus californicus TaxID=6832 RepID=UPI0027DA1887|nr:CD63 antigen-like [Tigriopus californicus]